MESYKVDFAKTGFLEIKGNVKTVVAHYKDGHTQTFPFFEFVVLKNKKNIVQIDCYTKEDGNDL